MFCKLWIILKFKTYLTLITVVIVHSMPFYVSLLSDKRLK